MKKKLLSIALTVCMLLTLLPTAALAADEGTTGAAATVQDEAAPAAAAALTTPLDFTNVGDNEGQTPATGTGYAWSGDATNGYRLELNNIDLTVSGAEAIKLPGNTELVLTGDNSVIVEQREELPWQFTAITCSGFLRVAGDGNLTVKSTAEGIQSNAGLVLDGTGVLDILVDKIGITTQDGDLVINSGTITTHGQTNSGKGLYVYDGDMIIAGGDITAIGEAAEGIYAYSDTKNVAINITGGTVRATGKSFGIVAGTLQPNVCQPTLTIGGTAEVTAISSGSGAIYATGNVSITGGNVKATAQKEGYPGIRSTKGNLIISGTAAVNAFSKAMGLYADVGGLEVRDTALVTSTGDVADVAVATPLAVDDTATLNALVRITTAAGRTFAAQGTCQLRSDITLGTTAYNTTLPQTLVVIPGAALTIPAARTLTVEALGCLTQNGALTVNGTVVLPTGTTADQIKALNLTGGGVVKVGDKAYTTDGVLHGGDVTSSSLDLGAVSIPTAYKAGSGTVLWEPEMDGETTIGGKLTLDGATIGGDVTFPALASGKTITVATKGTNTATSLVWSTSGNTLALNGGGKLTLSGQIDLGSDKTNTLSVTGGTSLLVEGSGTTGGWGIETDHLTMDADSTVTAKVGIHVTNNPDSTTWHSIKDSILHSGKPDDNRTWYEVVGNVKLAQDLTCISSNTYAFLVITDDESLTVPAGITLDLSAMTDVSEGNYLRNYGTLTNNGTILMPTGTTGEQIKSKRLTGGGLVKVGDVTYGNNGEIPHVYTAAVDFSKPAGTGEGKGNWDAAATLENDGYRWDTAANTLTLQNFRLTAAPDGNGALVLPGGDVKLALADGSENSVTNTEQYGTGIHLPSANLLTLSGGGNLEVSAQAAAISLVSGSLTISGGTLQATSSGSPALQADEDITVSGGSVTAEGGGNAGGILAGKNINVTGGKLTAVGRDSIGLHANGVVAVSGGTIRARGATTAIRGARGITLTGMSITSPAGAAIGDSALANRGKAVMLNGADVLSVTIEKIPSGGNGGGGSSSGGATVPSGGTTTNPDGSTTVTTITTQPDGTKETVATTTNTDDTKVVVTSTEKKQSDGSTVKTETVVKTDGKGNTTSASGTVTTDSKNGAVTVPADVIETLAKTEGATLTVETPNATLQLDNAALQALTKQGGKTPALTITPVSFEKLPQQAQKNLEGSAVFSFSVNGGGVDFGSGTVTVTLDYTRKAANTVVVVYYVDNNGAMTRMPGTRYQNGKATYKTNHFSLYAVTEEAMPFADVSVDAYYADAVLWAVDKGVTSGTSAATFNPGGICTRAQTVTFLWRAMGNPEPTSAVNPFTDVSADAYYYKAVLWAVEKGVTSGTSATTFNPGGICTRAQVMTFLWRAEGSPVVNYAMNFTDVAADAYYAEAVRWAVSEGITSGTSATTFAPAGNCSRAQIVTFLYRCLSK